MTQWPQSLALVGAGKMGGALLQGWLEGGLAPSRITLVDPAPSPEILALAGARHIALNPPAANRTAPEVLVLAVKPQMLDAAVPELRLLAGAQTLVLSIIAGKTIANLEARLPDARAFVRAMPNTPAAVGRGIAGAAASAAVTTRQRAITQALLCAVGQFEWLPGEDLIDAVTAVSGSGPAYVFALVEALAEAGAALGLAEDVAMRLARATVEGAGELMHREPDVPASRLRENVTSPAGTTAAALAALRAPDGLAPLMRRAVAAAHKRAGELAG
ncbi:pyrroline-5-carboxylate reductase [Methylocapsa sp. S129]|uniref:pyrroline-5-carboxylate reductase n=1 Tax=Methylocapsa sp. S129 TaxID=1641869 RepID=UPI00131C9ED7|nr:pyrroline-5-carboxylate reductase [Methylocapsa sp. S129]